MEEHSREIEESKRKLEKSLAEMELKLKDEKEKSLAQAIKASICDFFGDKDPRHCTHRYRHERRSENI